MSLDDLIHRLECRKDVFLAVRDLPVREAIEVLAECICQIQELHGEPDTKGPVLTTKGLNKVLNKMTENVVKAYSEDSPNILDRVLEEEGDVQVWVKPSPEEKIVAVGYGGGGTPLPKLRLNSYQVLELLEKAGPLMTSELVKSLALDEAGQRCLSSMLSSLFKKGLVVKLGQAKPFNWQVSERGSAVLAAGNAKTPAT